MVIEISWDSSSDSSVCPDDSDKEVLQEILNRARPRDFIHTPIDFIEPYDHSSERCPIPPLEPFDMDAPGPSSQGPFANAPKEV